MTKFTAPLYVGRLDSDATAVTIDTSGTATFTGSIQVSGSANVAGTITDRAARGQVIYTQKTTLLSDNSAAGPAIINLPSGSDVTDIWVHVEIPFGNAVGVTAVNVAVSAVGDAGLVSFSVSASTVPYVLGRANAVSFVGSTFRNITTTVEAHLSVQALATALTSGQAILGLAYRQN